MTSGIYQIANLKRNRDEDDLDLEGLTNVQTLVRRASHYPKKGCMTSDQDMFENLSALHNAKNLIIS